VTTASGGSASIEDEPKCAVGGLDDLAVHDPARVEHVWTGVFWTLRSEV